MPSLIPDAAAFERRLAGLPVVKHPAREVVLTAGSKTGKLLFSEVPRIQHRSASSCGPDFLRRRVKRKLVENDFDRALETAMKLAKGQEATPD